MMGAGKGSAKSCNSWYVCTFKNDWAAGAASLLMSACMSVGVGLGL
jgi:hypothetical protein